MQQTTNYNLKKIDLTDSPPDITVLNPNFDAIDAELKSIRDDDVAHKENYVSHSGYGTASGTNAKTITLNPAPNSYVDGMTVAFKNETQNADAVTLNVNGLGAKSVLKANGSALASGNIKANSIYTVRYNGTNFILQGEGGSGNATASDLLLGKTASVDAGDIVGSIPSKGAATITPSTVSQTINAGQYLSGVQTVAGDADLISANIKLGVNIFGVEGHVMPIPDNLIYMAGLERLPFVQGYDHDPNNWTSVTKQSNKFYFSTTNVGNMDGNETSLVLNSSISLTGINKIYVAINKIASSNINSIQVSLDISTSKIRGYYTTPTVRASTNYASRGYSVLVVDVSSLTGNYYISIAAYELINKAALEVFAIWYD